MVTSMYTSVEGTLANMGNMQKQYWSNIAPILGAIGVHWACQKLKSIFYVTLITNIINL